MFLFIKKFFLPKRQNFIMLTSGRAGSSYITEKINRHPSLRMEGERMDEFRYEPEPVRLEKSIAWIHAWYGAKYPETVKSVGFKTKIYPEVWPGASLDQLRAALRTHRVRKVILLLRKNRVKAAISGIRGYRLFKKYGMWNCDDPGYAVPPHRIEPENLMAAIHRRNVLHDTAVNFFSAMKGTRGLTIYYEELIADEELLFRRIYDFLEVPYRPTVCRLIKHTSDRLAEVITNLDELKEYLHGTPYEGMIHES